jgi:hypothetical protein
MTTTLRQAAVVLAVMSLALIPAAAQTAISARSGMVHYVEGKVLLADKPVESKFGQFPEVKEKQVLQTEAGRAEILLAPGVFLRLGENAAVRMITNRLIDTRVEVERGQVMVEAVELLNNIALVAKGASISVRKNGLYRIDADTGQVQAYEGEAVVEQGADRLTLRSARMTVLGTVLVAQKFDNKVGDSLYRWGKRRSEYVAMANVSSSRLLRDRGGWLSSGWLWNPYFGMFTFVPYNGTLRSPYGYSFWSPRTIMRVYAPPRRDASMTAGGGGGGSGYNSALGYNTASRSSGAYSSPAPAVTSAGSAPAAAASPRAAQSASPRSGGGGGR